MHVKKEGYTSEFLFGIYWWPWKTLIYQKNCWSEPIKNVRILIFTMLFKKIKIKKTPRDIIILYLCTKNYKIQLWYKKIQKDTTLFWEEISACATFHTSYVMNKCDHVQSIILLPGVMGMSFMLVMLPRLNVSELEH